MTPEKAARLAANSLIRSFTTIKRKTGPEPITSDFVQSRKAASGQWYLVKVESMIPVRAAARRLVPMLDFYPLDECIDELLSIVIQTKDQGTRLADAHREIKEHVLNFLTTISTQGEWETAFPVRGVELHGGRRLLGQCTFYRMDEQQFLTWGRRAAAGKYDAPVDGPLVENWQQEFGVLKGQAIAATRVLATNSEHARSKGLRQVEEALNLLRFKRCVLGLWHVPFPEVGLWAERLSHQYGICMRLDGGDFSLGVRTKGQMGTDMLIASIVPGASELHQMIARPLAERSEMQRRLSIAIQWIGEVARDQSTPVQLVALVTALEALLIENGESLGKRRKLAQRISTLIAESKKERSAVTQEVEDMYQLRNKCIHAGQLDVEKEEITRACKLLGRTVDTLLRKPYGDCKTLSDLIVALEGGQ